MALFFKSAKSMVNEHDELIRVLGRYAGVGLWDAILHEGDAADPSSKWWWSGEFRRLLGFDPDDEAAFPNEMTSWSDRLHPEDVEPTFNAFGELLADTSGRSGYDVTYRLRMKDNTYRWFQAVGGAVRDETGAPTRACGALIDVDEQKNLSERATVLDTNAGVGLWDAVLHDGDATHPDSKWTWSDEFRRLVGFEPGDHDGFPNQMNSWSDRLHPEDAGPTFDAFAACLGDASGNTGYDQEYRLMMRDGGYRWFRAIGGVTRHPDGTPARACGTLIDIDFEKQAAANASRADKLRADQLAGIAENLNSSVASAAENATANAQSVAASTEELTVAVSTILQHANDATARSSEASSKADETYRAVTLLSEGVEKIGAIVDMINNISMQTNLLALNASVEASRAGDAGKGFAVVAHEVRGLATQTGAATDQIGTQLSSLQSDAKEAVAAIKSIAETLGESTKATETIARGIAEQDTATRQISDGTRGVVNAIDLVSNNITAAAQSIMDENNLDHSGTLSSFDASIRTELPIAS
ncbi:methyl-accepting chemotaxis protein [Phaeobacter gallaeciensis]|uniref:Methyl-accepting chemotaxis sensory transducer with Pas/Pac sensor n=1 Tax=Phaeobacter gallaeciensis TaxID=60890 RepID=A0AAC9Z703_9RHOB|nr:PAS domain-containing protein [Phaeobacter gallaeciensis]AHD09118.1 methyl-accepting chemotaxis sensory transducer with Pas/Pac sensor [Phaeobacter gallaeciensis DSM 26640]ATE92381.1 methyl-accepting chemotaxis sensory transducer with Pas/Pac sensor [Phaeobacter gallaeciensis]ATE97797.1 methyl-accepting chemotaxis sensory transducer with Pas/Pac sensor [Phaeobacter gallaeciensis]ATF01046.1 methyl-accepting chemotaxis sensory transducer with Pas/Pac sensor [Phaeobacter gallaeciensis]ATF05426